MARRDGLSGDGLKLRATERRWKGAGKQRQAQRDWALRELEKIEAKRVKREQDREASGVAVLKTKKKRSKARGSRKAMLEEAATRMMVDQLVSPEARQHGDYAVVDFKLAEGDENADRKEKAKSTRVVRNLGGTPVERWHHRGVLDERQMAAILFYQQAWRTWIGEPRIVANWSAVIVRDAQGAAEIYAGSRIAAKESLRLLDNEVFFRVSPGYFQVWQNVVIWDQPAGVAGSPAGFLHKQAEGAARAIVSMLSSMIADVVIDNGRKDFGDLMLDLDAPRRPARRIA